ncbi:MAG: hypothetical protein ACLF0G_13835 [Candidatus Brocadiia bacterium]
MAPESKRPQDDDSVLSHLWEIAHKYQRSLTRGEVVPLAESEDDRCVVAPFAQRLKSTAERNLDGITYRSLAEMQVRRDTRRLLSNVPARARLRRLGFEVAVRARPVVFLAAPATVRSLGLLAAVAYRTEEIDSAGETGRVLEELEESEHRVSMQGVDEAELERLAGEVKARLAGRRFGPGELARTLSSTEADLLSQLARRGEVTLVARAGGGMEIREGPASRRGERAVAVAIEPQARGA